MVVFSHILMHEIGLEHGSAYRGLSGSFDPVTYGHLDVIERGIAIFEKLTVTVVANPRKDKGFSLEERLAMLKEATVQYSPAIEFDCFEGLLVDYMRQKKANVLLRGLRALSDFDFEFEMALANRGLAPEVETIFMMSSQSISSCGRAW